MISVKSTTGEVLREHLSWTTPSSMARSDPDTFFESFTALARCLRAMAAREYATFEVGSTQARFLRHIGRNGRTSQADLARATGTDPTLTGRALETLIERGWVRRERSEADRRQYALELTESGHRTRKRVEDARKRLIERVVAELDERDLHDFERISKKLLTAFEGTLDESTEP
ncbi:MarR family winged helix-turn-helix transcriptional regulator [Hyalangium versicolor]|uniref:MarR family winged helix-turn-helix transcriptional regulator n=1 Tax=Hyalangium versicolor TaxID=2861190 RepID=UPI001CCEF62C|nr:MarR family transcriptional regulator [Hyalangium versicolor]